MAEVSPGSLAPGPTGVGPQRLVPHAEAQSVALGPPLPCVEAQETALVRLAASPRKETHVLLCCVRLRKLREDGLGGVPWPPVALDVAQGVWAVVSVGWAGMQQLLSVVLASCCDSAPAPSSSRGFPGALCPGRRRRGGPDVPGMARVASGLRTGLGGKGWARSQGTGT